MNNKEIIKLYEDILETINEKDKEKYEEKAKKIGYYVGWFDKQGRYYTYTDFETETSKIIRTPSGRWPLSVWKHIKTKKYLKSLLSKIEIDYRKASLDEELSKKQKSKTHKI